MGIAERFPRAVERVENLISVFQAFHRPVISTVGPRLVCFGSLLLLRRSAETIRFRTGLQDVCAILPNCEAIIGMRRVLQWALIVASCNCAI